MLKVAAKIDKVDIQYIQLLVPMVYSSKLQLLSASLGSSKSGFRTLPPSDFEYGKEVEAEVVVKKKENFNFSCSKKV